MRRLALATIAAIVLTTGTAHAQGVPVPADTMPELGGILAIARSTWPDSPCTGREQIIVSEGIGAQNGLDADGGAIPELCTVALNPRLFAPERRYELCVIVTHEFGHLAGREHVADPDDIMHAVMPANFAPCLALVAPQIATPVARPAPTSRPVARHRTKTKCRQHNPKKRRACRRARIKRA